MSDNHREITEVLEEISSKLGSRRNSRKEQAGWAALIIAGASVVQYISPLSFTGTEGTALEKRIEVLETQQTKLLNAQLILVNKVANVPADLHARVATMEGNINYITRVVDQIQRDISK